MNHGLFKTRLSGCEREPKLSAKYYIGTQAMRAESRRPSQRNPCGTLPSPSGSRGKARNAPLVQNSRLPRCAAGKTGRIGRVGLPRSPVGFSRTQPEEDGGWRSSSVEGAIRPSPWRFPRSRTVVNPWAESVVVNWCRPAPSPISGLADNSTHQLANQSALTTTPKLHGVTGLELPVLPATHPIKPTGCLDPRARTRSGLRPSPAARSVRHCGWFPCRHGHHGSRR